MKQIVHDYLQATIGQLEEEQLAMTNSYAGSRRRSRLYSYVESVSEVRVELWCSLV